MAEKNMETVLKEIKELRGLEGLSNGRVLVSLFSDLSSDKKDLRLVRYLVESGCYTDLLEARNLSPAMQQARLQQTVKKLCAETLIGEEAAQKVCNTFWNAVFGINPNIITKPEIPSPPVRETAVPEPVASFEPKVSNVVEEPKKLETQNLLPVKEQKKSTTILIVSVLLLILILPIALFFTAFYVDTADDKAEVQTEDTEATREQISLSEYIQRTESKNGSRVLLEDPMQYNRDENGHLKTFPVFGTDLMRNQVASVTFLNTLKDAPDTVVDLSAARDGSVQSWIVPNGNRFDLYIAAEGGVKAPANSSGLFAYYDGATSISFNNSFDTSGAVYLDHMFYGCSSLKNVDLSGIDTENAETLDFFFAGCAGLTTVDVSSFDTANVTGFSFMFDECTGLKTLDVTNFNTSKAVDMAGMFSGCWFLEKLDLSNFHTENVTDMSFMFCNCVKLTDLNISNFDTASVTDMTYMFYDTKNLQNLDLSRFDVSNVEEYEGFMKDGEMVNGRPWEKLFTS